jgi:GH24 family phage-related lysozyme (muramidase)
VSNKSFQLIRTNPRLTTNYKIVISSDDNIYLESFNSCKELSDDKYKHYLLSIDAILEDSLPKFFNEIPKKLAFEPKYDNDVDIMHNSYSNQFNNMYYSGSKNIDDQWYKEEFEYFAPIYIKKNELPSSFIILRVDDPCVYEKIGGDYVIGDLNKQNFRKEIINKWKCVSVFDLTDNTTIGKFFNRNINNNDRFSDFSFFFDIKKYNYSKWGGLDYNTGVYKVSEMFLDDKLYYENPHFELEEFITQGFEDNAIIYPYILNMKFLFDDNPGTPNEMRDWSMNRYFGFYADDLELIKTITSYELKQLKSDLIIKNNIFLNLSSGYTNPYILNYTDDNWIQVDNDYYLVKLQSNGSFKIISDKNLTGYDVNTFNKNISDIININDKNYITNISNIDNYIKANGDEDDMYADIYLIDIDGMYHILKKDEEGKYYIQSDYAIISNKEILKYWKGGINSKYSKVKEISNDDGSPLTYNIYRVRLLDIKDFDFDRINTHYADFDYEKSTYYETNEQKLHSIEYRDNSIPYRFKSHDKGEDGQYKLINVSSEYTATDETFEIRSSTISPIFEKNQSICKWSYDGSISHSDYPYKLNNSIRCGGVNNRTTNVDYKIANYKEKTLDYFYRIGEFYGKDVVDFITGFTSDWENDWITIAANYIAKKEASSKFKAKPNIDEGTLRAGYGTDKILQNGILVKVTSTTVFTEESAKNTLVYQIKDMGNSIKKDLGSQNWDKLNKYQKASLVSIGYNAGPSYISSRDYGKTIKDGISSNDFNKAAQGILDGPITGKKSIVTFFSGMGLPE